MFGYYFHGELRRSYLFELTLQMMGGGGEGMMGGGEGMMGVGGAGRGGGGVKGSSLPSI